MGTLESINDNQFQEKILNSNGVVIIDFWAEWCAPCKALTPKLEQIEAEYKGAVKVFKCNTDENIGLASQYMVTSIPTLLFFKDGNISGSIIGNTRQQKIINKIEGLLD